MDELRRKNPDKHYSEGDIKKQWTSCMEYLARIMSKPITMIDQGVRKNMTQSGLLELEPELKVQLGKVFDKSLVTSSITCPDVADPQSEFLIGLSGWQMVSKRHKIFPSTKDQ